MRLSKFAAITMSGLLAAGSLAGGAAAQDQAGSGSSDAGSGQGNLSQQLNNPVAALISVPFQFDYNQNIGADDKGSEWVLEIEPVIPIPISENWNLINRIILPIEWPSNIPSGSGGDYGIGDTEWAFYFSPKQPVNGWTWGIGPALTFPTSLSNSEDRRAKFGAGTWGGGATGVVLRQTEGWTYGGLITRLVDFKDDPAIPTNSWLLQPFLAYSWDGWTVSLNSESSYNMTADNDKWSVPINLGLAKVVKLGGAPIQLKGGVRYWAQSPDTGPQDWGFRLSATFLFPRG
jgi:hypothetical protein